MRNDLVESLCIGGCIALVVLFVHVLTVDATPQIQLLALLLAAIVVACGQVVFTRWRQRRGIPPGSPPPIKRRVFYAYGATAATRSFVS